jgi:hypothetical protein
VCAPHLPPRARATRSVGLTLVVARNPAAAIQLAPAPSLEPDVPAAPAPYAPTHAPRRVILSTAPPPHPMQRWWIARRGFADVGSAAMGLTQRVVTWAGAERPGLARDVARWGVAWQYSIAQVRALPHGLGQHSGRPLDLGVLCRHRCCVAVCSTAVGP